MKKRNIFIAILLSLLPFILTVSVSLIFFFGPTPSKQTTTTPSTTSSSSQSNPLGSIVFVFMCFSPLIAVNGILATFVFNDATKLDLEKKVRNLWTAGTFFGGIIAFLIYLIIVRKKKK